MPFLKVPQGFRDKFVARFIYFSFSKSTFYFLSIKENKNLELEWYQHSNVKMMDNIVSSMTWTKK